MAAMSAAGGTSASQTSPITSFLTKPGEVEGFDVGKAQVYRDVSAIRDRSGEGLSPRVARRFEREGFVEAATVRLHGRAKPSELGISSVIEFESPKGAESELKAELREESSLSRAEKKLFRLEHFKVPGVPGAAGLLFLPAKEAAQVGVRFQIAEAVFVEGSCELTLVVTRLESEEASKQVIDGVRDILRRTGGTCPAAEVPTA